MWRSTAVLRSVDALKDSGFRNLPDPGYPVATDHWHEEEQSQSWRSAHPPDDSGRQRGGDTRAMMPQGGLELRRG